ncbi:nucleoside/nucleotide kinase family protein [Enterococcus sp. AZ163]|uniref:nucleoside/nucleotide kinase family protein n=1 Tax=Enterococcus sp. AZ163 TaxID=2774638 RepID=UPI003D26FF2F
MKTYQLTVNDLIIDADFDEENIAAIFHPLLKKWTELQRTQKQRIFIFLAAPPGCGKTTLALFLEQLSRNCSDYTPIQTLGLDGFHYEQAYLNSHETDIDGQVVPMKDYKGHPSTFNVPLLLKKLTEARWEDNKWPIYSRKLHDVIQDQVQLTEKIILLEGNYLLLDEAPWNQLHEYCADRVFLYAYAAVLEERLIERKMQGGLSYEKARIFYERSDKRNVEIALANDRSAETILYVEKGVFHPVKFEKEREV